MISQIKRSLINKVVRRLFPRFGLKQGDVIVASYPKSGSTWFRFILSNMIHQKMGNNSAVNYSQLNGIYAFVYDSHIYSKLDISPIPRFVKTHMPYDSRFSSNRCLLITRNPAEVMVSYYKYLQARKDIKYAGSISEFISDYRYGIDAWVRWHESWLPKADYVLRYEDLYVSGYEQINHILNIFQANNFSKEVIELALKRSEFQSIQNMEVSSGLDPISKKSLDENYMFARSGHTDSWKTILDTEQKEMIRRSVAASNVDLYKDSF